MLTTAQLNRWTLGIDPHTKPSASTSSAPPLPKAFEFWQPRYEQLLNLAAVLAMQIEAVFDRTLPSLGGRD